MLVYSRGMVRDETRYSVGTKLADLHIPGREELEGSGYIYIRHDFHSHPKDNEPRERGLTCVSISILKSRDSGLQVILERQSKEAVVTVHRAGTNSRLVARNASVLGIAQPFARGNPCVPNFEL